jgi:large subunit ribosomal protein L24
VAGLRVKKGDRVRVLSGKDRGKEGNVTRVLPRDGKVIVDGVNVAKKHQKATRATMQGGIIDRDMPVDASNVAVLCPKGHPSRVGYTFDAEGNKTRVCKKCGADLS